MCAYKCQAVVVLEEKVNNLYYRDGLSQSRQACPVKQQETTNRSMNVGRCLAAVITVSSIYTQAFGGRMWRLLLGERGVRLQSETRTILYVQR